MENRLARLKFCRDVLQRVGMLSVRGKRDLKPLDLTRVVFSDKKFFRWNYQGPAQNCPIWVVGAHGRPARKADLDPGVCINEHSQRNPGTMVGLSFFLSFSLSVFLSFSLSLSLSLSLLLRSRQFLFFFFFFFLSFFISFFISFIIFFVVTIHHLHFSLFFITTSIIIITDFPYFIDIFENLRFINYHTVFMNFSST